jgi:hypothetical protein
MLHVFEFDRLEYKNHVKIDSHPDGLTYKENLKVGRNLLRASTKKWNLSRKFKYQITLLVPDNIWLHY